MGGRQPLIDRFIPVRSSIDWDFSRSQLTNGSSASSAATSMYREILDKVYLNNNRKRILSFNNLRRRSGEEGEGVEDFASASSIIKRRCSTKYLKADRVLNAPGLTSDYNVNLLDWGCANLLAVALDDSVHLWNPDADGSTSGFVYGSPLTSVSWAPDGYHIAIGVNNSHILFWDSSCNRLLRTLIHGRSQEGPRVGALSWNGNILTSGGGDGLVIYHDPRLKFPEVQTCQGHRQEICGLKWSYSGHQLASGGSDGLVYIWDSRSTRWNFRFPDHAAGSRRALAWCPFSYSLLATGGGETVKFWSTQTGNCINSVNTGSQVNALLWNKSKQELLSSCEGNQGQLTLWDYPSMVKIGQLNGHEDEVLYLSQSPDGCNVASGSGDETIRLWNHVFPPLPEGARPFTNSHRTHIRKGLT